MKAACFALALVALASPVLVSPAMAQAPVDAAEHAAAMARLNPMKGEWRGTAKGNMRGTAFEVTQTERVGPMLDGDVMVIEGRGYAADGTVQFNAFAVVSYNTTTDKYEFRAYSAKHAGTQAFWITDTGYAWEMPAGPGAKIHYDIEIKGDTWHETGKFIRDGAEPVPFIELNLKRIGDTAWPAAGVVKPLG